MREFDILRERFVSETNDKMWSKLIHTDADNLELPICPKCNDTKYVEDVKTIKMIYAKTYRCTICDLEWNSRKY